jgi:hypothetical protein
MPDAVTQMHAYLPGIFIALICMVLLVQKIVNRNLPRLGGKIGRRSILPALPVPEGFSRVERREITLFNPPPDGANYSSLKTYLRGTTVRSSVVRIYRVAGCNTRIEILDEAPAYQRIEPGEALALLRELPDPRLVYRLHLRDEPSFLDPWVRKVSQQNVFLLGNATNLSLIVLYLPDRRFGQQLGLTLLHEWLHLLAFASGAQVRAFKRANAIEPLQPPAIMPVSFGDRRTPTHEAWSDLGEALLGYDETLARQAALAAPVHSMILWRCVEKILRKTPRRLRSTRFAEFAALQDFMQKEVAPKARAVRAANRPWAKLWRWLRRAKP